MAHSENQHPLWVEPHWTDSWSEGDRVVSLWTRNSGVVSKVTAGRHIYIRWAQWLNEPDGYTARHSSPLGLVKA